MVLNQDVPFLLRGKDREYDTVLCREITEGGKTFPEKRWLLPASHREPVGGGWASWGITLERGGAGAGGLEWTSTLGLAAVPPLLWPDRPGGEKQPIPVASGPGVTKDPRALNQKD